MTGFPDQMGQRGRVGLGQIRSYNLCIPLSPRRAGFQKGFEENDASSIRGLTCDWIGVGRQYEMMDLRTYEPRCYPGRLLHHRLRRNSLFISAVHEQQVYQSRLVRDYLPSVRSPAGLAYVGSTLQVRGHLRKGSDSSLGLRFAEVFHPEQELLNKIALSSS